MKSILHLNKKLKGPDHSFAIEPKEFKIMIDKIRKIEQGIGNGIKGNYSNEEIKMAQKARRSIHASRDIVKGDKISEKILYSKGQDMVLSHTYGKELLEKESLKILKKIIGLNGTC